MSKERQDMGKKSEKNGAGPLAPNQRWSVGRKREVVLRILRGEPLDELSRHYAVTIAKLENWRDRALQGMDEGLRDRMGDPLLSELENAKARLGELVMENELLRGRSGHPVPFGLRRLRK
jgi:transposase